MTMSRVKNPKSMMLPITSGQRAGVSGTRVGMPIAVRATPVKTPPRPRVDSRHMHFIATGGRVGCRFALLTQEPEVAAESLEEQREGGDGEE
jgi:hypothetical protein